MELNAWIEAKAGTQPGQRASLKAIGAVARLLRENPRTVYAWYRRERAPSFPSAVNIVIASRGEVDYNGIFGPLARPTVTVAGGCNAVG